MIRVRVMFVAAAMFPACLVAQSGPSATQRSASPVADSFKAMAALFGSRLVLAFDSIPASKYGYAPTAPQQTVGWVAQHLVEANYGLCERFGGTKRTATETLPQSDSVKARWPKEVLIAELKASFTFCASAFAQIQGDAALADDVPIGAVGSARTQQRARSLLLFITDLAEHYAQVSSYMRMIGLVPPSSLPMIRRAAVPVPPSVLSQYVGAYDIGASTLFGAPGIHVEITMQDDALILTPTNQPAAQLWPLSETEFFFKEIPATITFTRDATGVVTGLVFHNAGEDRPGSRVR
jgi:uncharacterized damage-inducible protein DinB